MTKFEHWLENRDKDFLVGEAFGDWFRRGGDKVGMAAMQAKSLTYPEGELEDFRNRLKDKLPELVANSKSLWKTIKTLLFLYGKWLFKFRDVEGRWFGNLRMKLKRAPVTLPDLLKSAVKLFAGGLAKTIRVAISILITSIDGMARCFMGEVTKIGGGEGWKAAQRGCERAKQYADQMSKSFLKQKRPLFLFATGGIPLAIHSGVERIAHDAIHHSHELGLMHGGMAESALFWVVQIAFWGATSYKILGAIVHQTAAYIVKVTEEAINENPELAKDKDFIKLRTYAHEVEEEVAPEFEAPFAVGRTGAILKVLKEFSDKFGRVGKWAGKGIEKFRGEEPHGYEPPEYAKGAGRVAGKILGVPTESVDPVVEKIFWESESYEEFEKKIFTPSEMRLLEEAELVMLDATCPCGN